MSKLELDIFCCPFFCGELTKELKVILCPGFQCFHLQSRQIQEGTFLLQKAFAWTKFLDDL